jgi:hypothetical protein
MRGSGMDNDRLPNCFVRLPPYWPHSAAPRYPLVGSKLGARAELRRVLVVW